MNPRYKETHSMFVLLTVLVMTGLCVAYPYPPIPVVQNDTQQAEFGSPPMAKA